MHGKDASPNQGVLNVRLGSEAAVQTAMIPELGVSPIGQKRTFARHKKPRTGRGFVNQSTVN